MLYHMPRPRCHSFRVQEKVPRWYMNCYLHNGNYHGTRRLPCFYSSKDGVARCFWTVLNHYDPQSRVRKSLLKGASLEAAWGGQQCYTRTGRMYVICSRTGGTKGRLFSETRRTLTYKSSDLRKAPALIVLGSAGNFAFGVMSESLLSA